MSQYAKSTQVSCDRSKTEIEKTLMRYGASQFAYATKENMAMITFLANKRQIRFILPLPDKEKFRVKYDGRSGKEKEQSLDRQIADWEQSCRQSWRALSLVIKAKLEAVEAGIVHFEEEFLAHIVLPGGKTMGQLSLPKIEELYQSNKVPQLEFLK